MKQDVKTRGNRADKIRAALDKQGGVFSGNRWQNSVAVPQGYITAQERQQRKVIEFKLKETK